MFHHCIADKYSAIIEHPAPHGLGSIAYRSSRFQSSIGCGPRNRVDFVHKGCLVVLTNDEELEDQFGVKVANRKVAIGISLSALPAIDPTSRAIRIKDYRLSRNCSSGTPGCGFVFRFSVEWQTSGKAKCFAWTVFGRTSGLERFAASDFALRPDWFRGFLLSESGGSLWLLLSNSDWRVLSLAAVARTAPRPGPPRPRLLSISEKSALQDSGPSL